MVDMKILQINFNSEFILSTNILKFVHTKTRVRVYAGFCLCFQRLGEEKPEEELMGKPKSSPRLPATALAVANHHVVPNRGKIYSPGKKFSHAIGNEDLLVVK